MSTFLFKYSVFGPINSRRLGKSLGINVLPTDVKHCNFDCVYCECGWTKKSTRKPILPTVESITEDLLLRVQMLIDRNVKVDTLTFAGNGEPTVHPDFDEIILSVKNIRDTFLPGTKIAVLNNSTLLDRPIIQKATKEIDYNICKLDAGTEMMWKRINQPKGQLDFSKVIENLKNVKEGLIIQTLFLRGEHNGEVVDNTSEKELVAYINLLKEIQPEQIMIYTLDREAPAENLKQVTKSELYAIAQRINKLGFKVSVA